MIQTSLSEIPSITAAQLKNIDISVYMTTEINVTGTPLEQ